jgi:hypothetical protein
MDWARIAGAAAAVAVLASQAVHLDYAHGPTSLAIGILGVEVLSIGDIPPAPQPSPPDGVDVQPSRFESTLAHRRPVEGASGAAAASAASSEAIALRAARASTFAAARGRSPFSARRASEGRPVRRLCRQGDLSRQGRGLAANSLGLRRPGADVGGRFGDEGVRT